MNLSEPLVWTTKGNLPVASLQYRTEWMLEPECIVFREIYTLDGEEVRRDVHTYIKPEQGVITAAAGEA